MMIISLLCCEVSDIRVNEFDSPVYNVYSVFKINEK